MAASGRMCFPLSQIGNFWPLCAPLYLNKVLSQKGHEQCQAVNLLLFSEECSGSSQPCDKGRQIRPCAIPLLSGFLPVCPRLAQWGLPGTEGSDETALADGQSSLLCVHRSTTARWHEGRVLSPGTPGAQQLQALKLRVKYCTQHKNFLKYSPEWRL